MKQGILLLLGLALGALSGCTTLDRIDNPPDWPAGTDARRGATSAASN